MQTALKALHLVIGGLDVQPNETAAIAQFLKNVSEVISNDNTIKVGILTFFKLQVFGYGLLKAVICLEFAIYHFLMDMLLK